jgi:hypothetical protein
VFSESKMATSANRRIKSANVTNQAIDQANSLLQNLPEKPKEVMSLREAVDELQEDIRAALAKGYSYDEIAEILSNNGIEISVTTLKRYAPAGRGKRKTAATKPRTRRSRKGEDDVASDDVDESELEGSEADTGRTTRKRGRSAAQALSEPDEEMTETEPKASGRGRRSDSSATKAKKTTRSTTRSTSRRRK